MIEASEMVDLSDLDLLDDGSEHCRCTYCTPGPLPALTPYVAICGRRVVDRVDDEGPTPIPENACEDCLRLWRQPCVRCGA